MATIRPSIYIGLGGTGILAISKTKKMFEDAYGKGNIPDQIAFVAIDFDLTMENNSELDTNMKHDFLNLKSSSSPKQLYNSGIEQGDYSWVFPSNARFIGDRISDGASQVRTYGRFLTEMVSSNIQRRIEDCVTQVKNIQNVSEHDEEKNQPIDIHIAMSLAGGTGCGSFINIAHLIRTKYQNMVNIIGYGVIHSVFRTMDPAATKTPRVVSNAYSAILDLDYLMGASNDKPIKVTLDGDKSTLLTQPIYDEFYVIDNETENGKRVDNIKKLCEVLGTCLYVAGGEMGSKIKSGQSNTGWKNGNFDISPKLGWVQSLGACQIVYKGELLADIYKFKGALEIIRKLKQRDADIQQKAVNWTEEIGIREDGDQYNMLIDSIYDPNKISKAKMPKLDIKDSMTETKATVKKYVTTLADFPSDKDIEVKSNDIINNLKWTIKELSNAENGVGNSMEFLESLEIILIKFKNEMESERSIFEKKQAEKLKVLDDRNYKEYEDYSKKLFSAKSGKEERMTDLIARQAQKALIEKMEAERRKLAYVVFTNVIAEVVILKKHIGEIDKKLLSLYNEYQNELASRQNSSESSLVFEYDLSYIERLKMEFKSSDVVISDFIASFNKSLLDIELNKELNNTIMEFVTTLKKADEYRNKLIVDVIEELDDKQYQSLIKEITEKSSRLLRLEDRGQKNRTRSNALATSMLVQNYLISLYNKTDEDGIPLKSRIEKDDSLLKDIKKDFVSTKFDSMKQKIIFYRSDMAIIPYCISAFDDVTIEREYNVLILDAGQEGTTSFNPHFDKHLFNEMRLSDFKLKPEMQNEAILYWVCGHIFGWVDIKENKYLMQKDNNGIPLKINGKEEVENKKYIRIKGGKYFYWNEDGESKGLDGKWVTINNVTQREQAFLYFKTVVLPQIKQTLKNKIHSDIKEKGKAYYEGLIDNIISSGKYDYIDQIVCSDKNSVTYYTQQKGEDVQFDVEWKYIEKHLKNALSNL